MRRLIALVLMVAGITSAVAGSFVAWGPGTAGLIAAGFLVPLSLLVGWE